MNKERRKQIQEIVEELNSIKDRLSELISDIESLEEEEQEYFDNIPENLLSSQRACDSEEAIDYLYSGKHELEDTMCYIDAAIDDLENAKGE